MSDPEDTSVPNNLPHPTSVPPRYVVRPMPNPSDDFLLNDILAGKVSYPTFNTVSRNNSPEKSKPVRAPKNEINFVVVVDSDNPNVGRAVKDRKNNTVTVYLAEGHMASEDTPNYDRLYEFWHSKADQTSAGNVITLRLSPIDQRACRFFSPGLAQVEAFEATMAEDYAFDRPHRNATCSNPDIIKASGKANPSCEYFQNQSNCERYAKPTWDSVREGVYTKDDKEVTVRLESMRRGWGTFDYRLMVVDGDPDIVDTVAFEDTNSKTAAKADKVFEKHLKANNGVETPKPVENEDNVKEEYLTYAFS